MAQFRSNLHHDPNVGEVPVPHGPETGEEYEQFPERRDYTEEEEREIFRHIIRPDDSFTENGTYWADLPWLQKAAFVNRINNQEAVKELKTIWAMMKKDPAKPDRLVPAQRRSARRRPGARGLRPLQHRQPVAPIRRCLAAVLEHQYRQPGVCQELDRLRDVPRGYRYHGWPDWCWCKCSPLLSPVYGRRPNRAACVQIIGDWLGRRWGLIQDAAIMFVGLLMLTASWGTTLEGWVICYAWSLFFYSEYSTPTGCRCFETDEEIVRFRRGW